VECIVSSEAGPNTSTEGSCHSICLFVILLAIAAVAVAPLWREILVVLIMLGTALFIVVLIIYLIRSGRLK
jgi:hypothetical protein